MLKITFNNDLKTREFINSLFDNSVDAENYIIDKDKNRAIDSDGQEITLSDLGAIKNGSEIYVRKNIVSLVNFYRKFLQSVR